MHPRAFTAGWMVGAVLLSSWAVSSASDQAPGRRPASAPDAPMALPAASADVESEIARLSAWTTSRAVPKAGRNPFEFEVRSAKFEVQGSKFVAAPAPPESTSNLPGTSNIELRTSNLPRLSGVAAQSGVLTAVVSLGDSLHFVKQGDVIAGRYRVDSVSADAVEVFDLTLGTNLRLTLQSLT